MQLNVLLENFKNILAPSKGIGGFQETGGIYRQLVKF